MYQKDAIRKMVNSVGVVFSANEGCQVLFSRYQYCSFQMFCKSVRIEMKDSLCWVPLVFFNVCACSVRMTLRRNSILL